MSTINPTDEEKNLIWDRGQAKNVLSGDGELGALVRDFDWAATPLGDAQSWPQSLRTIIRVMLASRFAMWMGWGPELTFVYNDAYARMTLGKKHPWALGRPSREVWAEIWDDIGPRIQKVLDTGEATWDEALLLFLERSGYSEETYHTFSYSPLTDDDGRVAGHLCVVSEETERVIGERRLTTLRTLASELSATSTAQDVMAAIERSLQTNTKDLPFTLTYLLSESADAQLGSVTGIARNHPAAPAIVPTGGTPGVWPVAELLARATPVQIDNIDKTLGPLPAGSWDKCPNKALLVPIASLAQDRPAGIFIAGLNPYRQLDSSYSGFIELIAGQISGSLANARAYEQERKRAESLAELDRAKTIFFSNISHELRTPLTLMLGPLEELVLKDEPRLGPEEHRKVDLARRNAFRLLKLVNSLLDFSRIEAGRMQAVFVPTDLGAFTAEIASSFRSAMEKAGLRLSVERDPLAPTVYVDRAMWEKIVLNLLSNAFKYTFQGEVAVSLMQVGNVVELRVRDTGVGISKHDQARVFERFHRVENVRARTYEGTGIGLALVHEFVKLHGGEVHLVSDLGRGSTFTVVIPLGTSHLPPDRIGAESTASPTDDLAYLHKVQHWFGPAAEDVGDSLTLPSRLSVESGSDTKKELIILADDNTDMRDYLAHLLRDQFEVHAEADGALALEAVRRLKPALVLSDVMMPGLGGFALLNAIRNDQSLRSIPVILLSARAGEESRVGGLQAGADDYLVKPFTARELIARVTTHVRMANLRREAAEREAQLRAEADLERRRFQELLAQAPAGIGVLTGPEHRWSFVNDLYVHMTGRQRLADFLGKTLVESLPEFETQPFIGLLDEVYRTGTPYFGREMMTKLNRGKAGEPEEAYLDFVYQPIKDANGNVEGIFIHAVEVTDRVAARNAIKKNEDRLLLAQTAAQIGTWEWEPVKASYTLSEELHRLFGTDPSDALAAQKWAARVHGPDRAKVEQCMAEAQRTGELDFEYRYDHPDLGLRWFYCKGGRFTDETRMYGIIQDITERKQIEQALHANEQRMRLAQQAAGIGTFEWNLVTNENQWSPELEAMYGLAPGTFGGRLEDWERLVHPEDRPDALRQVEISVQTATPRQAEWRTIWPDGSEHWLLGRWQVFRDDTGAPVRMAGVNIDVTVRKTADEAQRHLAALVESSEDAIISKSLAGIVKSWNPQAERLFGYSQKEMIGQPIRKIIPPELQDEEDRILATIERGQGFEHFETVRVAKDGRRINVALTISPIFDENRQIVGASKIARDITHRLQTEKALQMTERLASVGRLAATIAHEINNPLEAMTNLLYLARTADDPEQIRSLLTQADEELNRVAVLTRQTLGFYREKNGAKLLRIGSIVKTLVTVFAPRARNKSINFKLEVREDPEINAIESEIRQLMANLLTNSMDAIGGSGTIQIRISSGHVWNQPSSRGVRITVADSGCGIAPENRAKLFEPFFTAGKEVGTGLGLWISKGIVDRHGGNIRFKTWLSQARSGTVFSVFLPSDSTPRPIGA